MSLRLLGLCNIIVNGLGAAMLEELNFNGLVRAITTEAERACRELLGQAIRALERRAVAQQPGRWVNRGQPVRHVWVAIRGRYLDGLRAALASRGIGLEYLDTPAGLHGWSEGGRVVIRRGLLPAGQRTAISSHGGTPANAPAPKSNSTVNSPLATSTFGTVCGAAIREPLVSESHSAACTSHVSPTGAPDRLSCPW